MSKQRIYNSILNPDLWKTEGHLDNVVAERLLRIAEDFYTESKITAKLRDVYFLGSSANFNWTPTSDIDLHLVIDTKELGVNESDIQNYLNTLKSKWNYEHEIRIRGHVVEVCIQDIKHKTVATGIYSIIKNRWISKPVYQNVRIDPHLIKSKFKYCVYKIKQCLRSPTVSKIQKLVDDIRKMRQAGLDSAGEMSTENIVFKLIRNKGYVKKLKKLKNKIYDRNLDLKEDLF